MEVVMEVKRNGGDVESMRAEEQMAADMIDQSSKIDYLAMMADVEFPGDEANVEGVEELPV